MDSEGNFQLIHVLVIYLFVVIAWAQILRDGYGVVRKRQQRRRQYSPRASDSFLNFSSRFFSDIRTWNHVFDINWAQRVWLRREPGNQRDLGSNPSVPHI